MPELSKVTARVVARDATDAIIQIFETLVDFHTKDGEITERDAAYLGSMASSQLSDSVRVATTVTIEITEPNSSHNHL